MIRKMVLSVVLAMVCFQQAHAQTTSIQHMFGSTSIRENNFASYRLQLTAPLPQGWSATANIAYNSNATPADIGPVTPWVVIISPTVLDYIVPINVGGGNEGDESFAVSWRLLNGITFVDSRTQNTTILGTSHLNAGDANKDFSFVNGTYFTSVDIVQVLAQGKYLTGLPAAWYQGDFNGDGQFNQFDLIGL